MSVVRHEKDRITKYTAKRRTVESLNKGSGGESLRSRTERQNRGEHDSLQLALCRMEAAHRMHAERPCHANTCLLHYSSNPATDARDTTGKAHTAVVLRHCLPTTPSIDSRKPQANTSRESRTCSQRLLRTARLCRLVPRPTCADDLLPPCCLLSCAEYPKKQWYTQLNHLVVSREV